jgi:hypothetical protein
LKKKIEFQYSPFIPHNEVVLKEERKWLSLPLRAAAKTDPGWMDTPGIDDKKVGGM